MSILVIITKIGHPSNSHILDNEASLILKQALLKKNIKYQILSPHIYQCNDVEQAIQSFKEHFIDFLCAADSQCLAK